MAADRHPGITMHKLSFGGGFVGLLFAAGSALIFVLGFPTLWYFVAFAVAGASLCFKTGRSKMSAPLVLITVYSVLVTLPILAQARYSVPMVPVMAIFAAVAIAAIVDKMPSHGSKTCLALTDASQGQFHVGL